MHTIIFETNHADVFESRCACEWYIECVRVCGLLMCGVRLVVFVFDVPCVNERMGKDGFRERFESFLLDGGRVGRSGWYRVLVLR